LCGAIASTVRTKQYPCPLVLYFMQLENLTTSGSAKYWRQSKKAGKSTKIEDDVEKVNL